MAADTFAARWNEINRINLTLAGDANHQRVDRAYREWMDAEYFGLEHSLHALAIYFEDNERLPRREARAKAHMILDVNPVRWAAVRRKRHQRERAEERSHAAFLRRVEAFTASYSAIGARERRGDDRAAA